MAAALSVRQGAGPPMLASRDRPQRDPLGQALQRDAEPEQMRDSPEYPEGQVEQPGGQRDRTPAQYFHDSAGLAAFGSRKLRQAAQILGLLGKLQSLDGGAGAGLGLHPTNVPRRTREIFHPLEPRRAQQAPSEPASFGSRFDHRKTRTRGHKRAEARISTGGGSKSPHRPAQKGPITP